MAIYLKRCGQLSLDISLGIFNEASRPVWRLILACSHRWRTARIAILTERLLGDLLACKEKVPILEILDVFVPHLHSGFDNYDAFKIAPQLNTVGLNCGSAIRRWTLPWSQLIKLNVTMSTLFDVSTLLRELLNVEELLLNFSGIEDHVTDNLSLLGGFFVRLKCILVLQVPFPI